MVCTLMEKDMGLGHGLHSHGKGYGTGSWSALSRKRIWDWVLVFCLGEKAVGLDHGQLSERRLDSQLTHRGWTQN